MCLSVCLVYWWDSGARPVNEPSERGATAKAATTTTTATNG